MSNAPLVLFFGEDSNDTASLIHLTKALLPENYVVDTRSIRRPPILRRDTNLKKKRAIAEQVASFAKPLSKGKRRVIVVAHRDCDACEDAHKENAAELEAELRKAGVAKPIAATPAWELESWAMLFPDELAQTRRCWRRVDYGRRRVGLIENAKETLRRDLRPVGARQTCPDYTESDSIKIFRLVSDNRSASKEKIMRSNSLALFCERINEEFEVAS